MKGDLENTLSFIEHANADRFEDFTIIYNELAFPMQIDFNEWLEKRNMAKEDDRFFIPITRILQIKDKAMVIFQRRDKKSLTILGDLAVHDGRN
jgi:hypothetical protein